MFTFVTKRYVKNQSYLLYYWGVDHVYKNISSKPKPYIFNETFADIGKRGVAIVNFSDSSISNCYMRNIASDIDFICFIGQHCKPQM